MEFWPARIRKSAIVGWFTSLYNSLNNESFAIPPNIQSCFNVCSIMFYVFKLLKTTRLIRILKNTKLCIKIKTIQPKFEAKIEPFINVIPFDNQTISKHINQLKEF